jgi:hypothetical protein
MIDMNYHITIELDERTKLACDASIAELPEAYIHFAHHDFTYEWNPKTRSEERLSVDTFFGGMGEGRSYSRWQDALLGSLYDLFQVDENLIKGDTFTATYLGETETFLCYSVHVLLVPKCPRGCGLMHVTKAYSGSGELREIWECADCRSQKIPGDCADSPQTSQRACN